MRASESRSQAKPADLQQRVMAHLVSYTAAAGAALSIAVPAEARVVYVPVDNVTVTPGFTLTIAGESVLRFNFPHGIYSDFITVLAPHGVMSGMTSRGAGLADKLNSGSEIGPSQEFGRGIKRMDEIIVTQSGFPFSYGPWFVDGGPTTGYLGFRFEVNGERHFGWARLTFTGYGNPTITLGGYAFETEPETALNAGQENALAASRSSEAAVDAKELKPSLGMLAFGWRALPLWRKN